MAGRARRSAAQKVADLHLGEATAATLRAHLPAVAEKTVAAITAEVPGYAGALTGEMGQNIQQAVQMALGGFLSLAARAKQSDPSTPLQPALEAAYALGRGEARSGRSMDALLAAYRVGARVAWRELSGTAVADGLPADTLARFAELVFAYIDELSASSVAGHADELATTGRVRERYLERLAKLLLGGASTDALEAAAQRADWVAPRDLTAVLLPQAQVRGVLALLDGRPLQPGEDVPDLDPAEDVAVLLVADAGGRSRPRLLRAVADRAAVVGPARPWTAVRSSYQRAVRARRLLPVEGRAPVLDTEAHLPELVLAADQESLRDLRDGVLAPLASLRPASRQRLTETLRSWLLHHGRREDIAAELFIHPQTVRYRMGQLRGLYGDRLDDPRTVLELTLALAAPADPTQS